MEMVLVLLLYMGPGARLKAPITLSLLLVLVCLWLLLPSRPAVADAGVDALLVRVRRGEHGPPRHRDSGRQIAQVAYPGFPHLVARRRHDTACARRRPTDVPTEVVAMAMYAAMAGDG